MRITKFGYPHFFSFYLCVVKTQYLSSLTVFCNLLIHKIYTPFTHVFCDYSQHYTKLSTFSIKVIHIFIKVIHKGHNMQSFELNNIWEDILQEIKRSMPPSLYDRIAYSIYPIELQNNEIHIGCMQSFIKNLIESQPAVSQPLHNAIKKVTKSPKQLILRNINEEIGIDTPIIEAPPMPLPSQEEPYQEEFYTPIYQDPVVIERKLPSTEQNVVTDSNMTEEPVHISDEPMVVPKKIKQQTKSINTLQPKDVPIDLSASNLNPLYRFDNYITGNANRIPFSAAQYVSEHPGGQNYNPLFIYGPSGLGKTHLMHAIGNAINEKQPNLKVMSITSEKFVTLFVESIQKGQGELFRNTFRNIDVLMIDDIQYLENKQGTKTEFFNTFNELYNNGKQIVLTSDTMPDDMDQFEERIRSRFQAGFVATMEHPDLETRIAILKSLIERENKDEHIIDIENDAINYMALQFDENIRKLQGAFRTLIASASKETMPINLEFTRKTLANLIKHEHVTYINIETIQDVVSTYFNIKKQDLLGKKRKAQFAFPRQIAMYLCRDVVNESYPQIAQAFSRDHTTILHAYDKISKEIDKNQELKQQILEIKEKLNSNKKHDH